MEEFIFCLIIGIFLLCAMISSNITVYLLYVFLCILMGYAIYIEFITNEKIKNIVYEYRMNKLVKGRISRETLYLKQDKYLDYICREETIKRPECIKYFLKRYTDYAKLNNLPIDIIKSIYGHYLEKKETYKDYPDELKFINQDIEILEKYLK